MYKMMKNKAVWILGICCVAAIVFSIIIWKQEDRNKPQIQFVGKITYHDNMTDEELLKDVRAFDQEEGDISDRIVVDSIVKMNGKDYVKIYYAVVDSSGNGIRVGKEVPYTDGIESDDGEEPAAQETFETIEETTEETIAETETAVETESVVESESESPVLTMKAGEASIAVGTQFIYQNHIESIVDNKDQEMDLFREVVIEGDYDCNTPGTYSLVFYTYDSDNNRSNEVPFTLIVQ